MPNDRSHFLASLSEEQLRALHAELEGLDRAQEGVVEDTTPRLADLLDQCWKQEAAQTDDPEGYMVAARAHHAAYLRHFPPCPAAATVKELRALRAGGPAWAEAVRIGIFELSAL